MVVETLRRTSPPAAMYAAAKAPPATASRSPSSASPLTCRSTPVSSRAPPIATAMPSQTCRATGSPLSRAMSAAQTGWVATRAVAEATEV